jgi:hypothetical protein
VLDDLHGELAVRGRVGDGLIFHFGTDSSLRKWEKGNTEGGGTAKTRKGIGGPRKQRKRRSRGYVEEYGECGGCRAE